MLRKVHLPKTKRDFSIETGEDFIKLHTILLAVGRKGGGKSVAVANIAKVAKDRGYFDRILLVTPTYASNREIWDICGVNKHPAKCFRNGKCETLPDPEPSMARNGELKGSDNRDVLDAGTPGVVSKLEEWVETERREWEDYLEAKEMYKEYLADTKRYENIEEVPASRLLVYRTYGFFSEGPPKWKYKEERPPRLAVILDDCLGQRTLSHGSEGFVNFCIKHRHLGDGLGVSVFILLQTWSMVGGLAPPIRENAGMALLFEQGNEDKRRTIFKEMNLPRYVEYDDFEKLLNQCTEKPHGYLAVDFNPKTEEKRFQDSCRKYVSLTRKRTRDDTPRLPSNRV